MAIYMTIMKQSNNLSASPLPVPNRTPKYTAADFIAQQKWSVQRKGTALHSNPFMLHIWCRFTGRMLSLTARCISQ